MTQNSLTEQAAENTRLRESLSMCAGTLWRLMDKGFIRATYEDTEDEVAHLLDVARNEVDHARKLLGLGAKP